MVDAKIKKINNEGLLINRLKSGQEAALKQIFDLYWYEMHETAKSKLKSEDKAKAIVKEVFVTLWNSKDIVIIQDLSDYLFTSLKFKILDLIEN